MDRPQAKSFSMKLQHVMPFLTSFSLTLTARGGLQLAQMASYDSLVGLNMFLITGSMTKLFDVSLICPKYLQCASRCRSSGGSSLSPSTEPVRFFFNFPRICQIKKIIPVSQLLSLSCHCPSYLIQTMFKILLSYFLQNKDKIECESNTIYLYHSLLLFTPVGMH